MLGAAMDDFFGWLVLLVLLVLAAPILAIIALAKTGIAILP